MSVLLLVCLVTAVSTAGAQEDEVNPFIEAAKTLITDAISKSDGGAGGAVGSIVQGLMASSAGKHIGDLMTGSKGIGDLLSDPQVLQSVMSSLNPQPTGDRGERSAGGGGGGGAEGGEGGGGLGGLESILGGLVPLLMQQGHEHHDDPQLEDTESHNRFDMLTNMIKPILKQAWEVFATSEMGHTLWEESGLKDTVDLFATKGGIRLDEALKSLENPQFRKKWLRSLVAFVTKWVKHISDPATQIRYKNSLAQNINTFLKSYGYKNLFLFGRSFEESLINVIDKVFKGTLGITVNSASYIKPAVKYFNQLIAIGRLGAMGMSRDMEDQFAETLNQEVIEGILRVHRAFRYALTKPQCDQYLLCELNRESHHKEFILRPGVTKASSLVAAWFLSGHTGTPFWKLYQAVVGEDNCSERFPVDCSGFHEEDIRVTTEYYHNEL